MRLDLKARERKIYIYIIHHTHTHSVYMSQATEQEKNLGNGEQNFRTSEQCLKQYNKITK